jgi:hypothetical protein
MNRAASTAATAAFVIAAMGLGRLITDHVPLQASAVEPFTVTAGLGQTAALEYAEVTVTGIRVTPRSPETRPRRPAGAGSSSTPNWSRPANPP